MNSILYINDKIYVLGGVSMNSEQGSIAGECFSEEVGWRSIARFNTEIKECSACHFGNYIYACGANSPAIERYDIQNDRWTVAFEHLDPASVSYIFVNPTRGFDLCVLSVGLTSG
jgi:hypothetical protein